MPPILYKMDQSPTARSVMIVADLIGLPLDMRDLNPVTREQDQPKFFKKNPMRTIPLLDDEDFSLADSHAISLYLLEKYGKPEHEYLYPKDARKRATINQRIFFDCGILFNRLRAIMSPTYMGRLTEISKYMIMNVEDAYKTMEAYLSQNSYLADDVMTVADICAFTTVATLHGLIPVDEAKHPNLKRWIVTMSSKDVIRRINEKSCRSHVRMLRRLMEINKENQKSKL